MRTTDSPPARSLTAHERELWRDVTRSIAPLKPRRAAARPVVSAPEKKNAVAPPRSPAAPVRPARVAKGPPALLPIDRRTRQRIVRGVQTIDARIDLHGRSQGEAHSTLLAFLHRAQCHGARIVLVITGKGSGELDSSRGILKRQVPLWLNLPEFRTYVSALERAHAEHGGEGALYVRLRRAR